MTIAEFADFILNENEAKSKEILRSYYLEKEPAVRLIPSFEKIYGNTKGGFLHQTSQKKFTRIEKSLVTIKKKRGNNSLNKVGLMLRGNVEMKNLSDVDDATTKPKICETQLSTKSGFKEERQHQQQQQKCHKQHYQHQRQLKRDFFGQKKMTERLYNGTTDLQRSSAEQIKLPIEIKVENTVHSHDDKYCDVPDYGNPDNSRTPSPSVVPETKSCSILDELIGGCDSPTKSRNYSKKFNDKVPASPICHVKPESVSSDSRNFCLSTLTKKLDFGRSVLDDLLVMRDVESEMDSSKKISGNREETTPDPFKSVLDDLLSNKNVKSEMKTLLSKSGNDESVTQTVNPHPVKSVLDDLLDFGKSSRKQRKIDPSVTSSSDENFTVPKTNKKMVEGSILDELIG